MNVYAIGGLGADERVFQELNLNFELIPLSWIEPLPRETLEEYARRFGKQIKTEEPFMLLGVSFGGILCQELAKSITPEKLILISSACSTSDIPVVLRLLGKLGFLSFLPSNLFKPPSFLTFWLFGVTEPRFKAILKDIIRQTDSRFLKWALGCIALWKPTTIKTPKIRIHGSNDRLLKATESGLILINGAGHFMIMNRSKEVSDTLNRIF